MGPTLPKAPINKELTFQIYPTKVAQSMPLQRERPTQEMSPLLNLPAELRLHIYSYLVPNQPLSISSDQFTRLLYSCKAIQHELEPEIRKRIASDINSIVEAIRAVGVEICYTKPTTFYGWRNFTFACSNKSYMSKMGNDSFYLLMHLRFDILTTVFYDHLPPTLSEVVKVVSHLKRQRKKNGLVLAMNQWILDWDDSPRRALRPVGADESHVCANRDTWSIRCTPPKTILYYPYHVRCCEHLLA
jgi:hypothetical protein